MSIKQWNEDSPASPVQFVLGVDLGQSRDYTALVVNEVGTFERVTQQHVPGELASREARRQRIVRHNIRWIERLPLGTSYPDIVRRVCDVMDRLPPMPRKPVLCVDSTGVGRPVLDAMREAGLRPLGVTITGGSAETQRSWDDVSVPKKVLASLLHVALDNRRLKFAAGLPELDNLTRELASFRVKATASRNETFEAWREREHDDLVLALALSVWAAERREPEPARMVRLNFMGR